jgi:hypothetical protein
MRVAVLSVEQSNIFSRHYFISLIILFGCCRCISINSSIAEMPPIMYRGDLAISQYGRGVGA